MGCTITWGDNGKQSDSDTEINRNVLYIPQNRLFNISSRPEEVTKLINSSIDHSMKTLLFQQKMSIEVACPRKLMNILLKKGVFKN